jgi:hypothetical protein
MSQKKTTTKGGAKGKAEGSRKNNQEEEVKSPAEAVAYAQRAYDAALAHYAATGGESRLSRSLLVIDYDEPGSTTLALRIPDIMLDTCQTKPKDYRDWRTEAEYLARILEHDDCPPEFTKAFTAVFGYHLFDPSGLSPTDPAMVRIILPLAMSLLYRMAHPANADTALEIIGTMAEEFGGKATEDARLSMSAKPPAE